jgi:hypothetical protein
VAFAERIRTSASHTQIVDDKAVPYNRSLGINWNVVAGVAVK